MSTIGCNPETCNFGLRADAQRGYTAVLLNPWNTFCHLTTWRWIADIDRGTTCRNFRFNVRLTIWGIALSIFSADAVGDAVTVPTFFANGIRSTWIGCAGVYV